VVLLLRASQHNSDQAELSEQLRQLVQSAGVSGSDSVASPTVSTNSSKEIEQGMADLENDARTLAQWLEKGRSTQASAEQAAALVLMVSVLKAKTDSTPNTTFWNDFSDELAVLQTSVDEGDIKTPEAVELIAKLQTQVTGLRSGLADSVASNTVGDSVSATSAVDDVVDGTNAEQVALLQAEQLQELDGKLDGLLLQHELINRLHNRALIIASVSGALFCLLLWGMWRSARRRHKRLKGKHKSEQDAIVRLLDEITPLAQGDLRVKATVGEASTGAIADAFNFAVDELRRLVHAVTESADLVNSSVNETRDSAYHLARASSVQAREVHRSSNHLNVMSDTMAQLSAHAVESSRIAELSVEHARAGNQAVQSNADSLLRIRDQADMTSRLMQRLVETAGAINERVRDIQNVAQRTDLLALNATIRSSAQISNGSGEDVSLLSDDIAHLSDTLGQATRDITNLSDIVQQDAIITLKSMAKTVYELDDGQRTAVRASDALTEIDRVSINLNGLISDMASKSLKQAGVVKQLSSNMAVINNITSDSARQLQESAKALEALQMITSELRDSVSDFKLPYDSEALIRAQMKRSTPPTAVRVNSKLARRAVKHA